MHTVHLPALYPVDGGTGTLAAMVCERNHAMPYVAKESERMLPYLAPLFKYTRSQTEKNYTYSSDPVLLVLLCVSHVKLELPPTTAQECALLPSSTHSYKIIFALCFLPLFYISSSYIWSDAPSILLNTHVSIYHTFLRPFGSVA